MAAQARHADKWVTEGIISRDQAESICEYERQVTPSRVTAFESLAYVGAAMVASAAFVLAADVWDDLSLPGRFGLLALIASSLLIIGLVSATDESALVRRLAAVALALSIPAIGFAAEAGISKWAGQSTSILIGSAAAWSAAIVLYGRWKTNPQHLMLFFSTLGFVLSVAMHPFLRIPDALPGTIAVVVGMAWVALVSTGSVTPRLIGEILGSVTALVASLVLAVTLGSILTVAAAIFVLAAIGGIAFGASHDRGTLTAFGIVALVVHIPLLTTELLGPDFGAPLSLFLTGAAIVYGVKLVDRRSRIENRKKR